MKRKFSEVFSDGSLKFEFDKTFDDRVLKLVEISSPELEEYIERGGHLEIKGSVIGKDSVLCTDSSTYDLKKVENSNTVILAPITTKSLTLQGQNNAHYEISLIKPRINQIKHVLHSTQSLVDNHESDLDMSLGLNETSFFGEVQASKNEIVTSLPNLGVVRSNGKVRLISPQCFRDVLRTLIDTIQEHSWQLTSISLQKCLDANPKLDPNLLKSAMHKLGCPINEEDINGLWRLDLEKVAVACAHDLFLRRIAENEGNSAQQYWPCDDFVSCWMSRTPGIAQPDVEWLRGTALTEDLRVGVTSSSSTNSHRCYRYFPREELPIEIKARFSELYKLRSSYTVEEIAPYLEEYYGCPSQPKSLLELLLLHTKRVDNQYQLK